MEYKNKFFVLGLILLVFLSVSCVCASENQTVLDDSSSDLVSDDETVAEDNYDAKIIAKNFTAKYSPYNEYDVFLLDEDGEEIPDEDVRILWSNGNQERLEEWDDYSGYYTLIDKNVGNYNATIVLKDSYYNAKPVTINVKITKANVKLTPKVYYSTQNSYATLKATVYDHNGESVDEGTVKFTINGKSYTVKVSGGVAIKKVKLSKAKTYTYKATFTGSNYNSKSATSKVHVYSISKKARTFKIKGYKVVVPVSKYKNLVNAKNKNKLIYLNLKTNKYYTQKVGHYKNSLKKVKARVSILISYGGKNGGQYGVANKYFMTLLTPYQNPGWSYCTPWLYGAKKSATINKLTSAKTTRW